jgi:hydrogenase maturation protease
LLYAGKLTRNNDILILGLGSEILMDDGLPLRIIADLKKDPPIPGLHYRTANNGGLDLLDHFSGFRDVIIIDTVMTKQGVPGQVWFFNATDNDCMDTLHLSCCHDTTFSVTLALGRKLGLSLPDQIWILAIEIIEGLEFSIQSSEQVESVYPGILAEIKENINCTIRYLMVRPLKKIKEPEL